MAKPEPITIPAELIGGIPRPATLIERVAKGDAENPDLKIIRKYRKPDEWVFAGVIVRIDRHIEIPEEVRDRSIELGKNCLWC
jgi:hypothetical protein